MLMLLLLLLTQQTASSQEGDRLERQKAENRNKHCSLQIIKVLFRSAEVIQANAEMSEEGEKAHSKVAASIRLNSIKH